MAQLDRETASLICADKVEGTPVYNGEGDKLGMIEDVVLDKSTGKVAYAVMSFGGFLGMGEKHHPLPWNAIEYNHQHDGYIVNIAKETLENAPTMDSIDDAVLADRSFGERVHTHYGISPYWS
ncbi:MAG: PRC-barrel domain-containing protein [Pseudomonadota bacterium]